MENQKSDLLLDGEMHQITEKIFLSDLNASGDEQWFQRNKINTVINVSNHKNYNLQDGVRYFHLPMVDGHPTSKDELVAAVGLLESEFSLGKTVLVHCLAGVSRSATIISLWLAWRYPVAYPTFEKAVGFVASIRPCIDPNKHFLKVAPEALLILKQ